ncbi:MAG TPA: hypothetical protein VK211_15075 [Kamptonema sp.]|nr:hypothetical protein [Kamptonema sp.]
MLTSIINNKTAAFFQAAVEPFLDSFCHQWASELLVLQVVPTIAQIITLLESGIPR